MQYFAYNGDQTVISITTRVNKHYYYYEGDITMQSSTELRSLLNRIDHRGYPAYKDTKGAYLPVPRLYIVY